MYYEIGHENEKYETFNKVECAEKNKVNIIKPLSKEVNKHQKQHALCWMDFSELIKHSGVVTTNHALFPS
jgi:hypothetical protein